MTRILQGILLATATLQLLSCGDPDKDDSAGPDTAPHGDSDSGSPDSPVDTRPPDDTAVIVDDDGDGWSPDDGDCDDDDPTVHPGADETCNGIDDDCDGSVDEEVCGEDCDLWLPWQGESIQEAVDLLPDGATLCLDAGNWSEPVVIENRSLTLVGLRGPWISVLQGGEAHTPLTIRGTAADTVRIQGVGIWLGLGATGGGLAIEGATVELEDVILWESEADRGGGMAVTGGATVTASALLVEDCDATHGGGGVYVDEGSSLTISDSELLSNGDDSTVSGTAMGGALWAGGGSELLVQDVLIRENTASNWNAYYYDAAGGGVYLEDVSAELVNVWFEDNVANAVYYDAIGGGLAILGASEVDIQGASFTGNQSTTSGIAECYAAAVHVGGSSQVSMSDVLFQDNTLEPDEWTERASVGGMRLRDESSLVGSHLEFDANDDWALYADGAYVELSHTVFLGGGDDSRGMIAGGDAAVMDDIVVQDNVSGGLDISTAVSATLTNLLITGNGSEDSYRGGLNITAVGSVSIDNAIITNNDAENGGGLQILHSPVSDLDLTLNGVVIVDNTASSQGGGIWFEETNSDPNTLTVTISNSIIHENTAAAAGGVGSEDETTTFTLAFDHCDLYGNSPDDAQGIDDPVGSDGNVSVEPDFLTQGDRESHGLHLDVGSPLIDAGASSAADPDGSPADMGAFGGPLGGSWDLDGDGYPQWWQPGSYDSSSYPAAGWDCDDHDAGVYPGAGC